MQKNRKIIDCVDWVDIICLLADYMRGEVDASEQDIIELIQRANIYKNIDNFDIVSLYCKVEERRKLFKPPR